MYDFHIFIYIFLCKSKKKFFSVKIKIEYKTFFPYKFFFSAKNVYFVKNKSFSKKNKTKTKST